MEKLFIQEKIYRKIETVETWEGVLETVYSNLKPFEKHLHRKITNEDLLKLLEIKIKRISKYDSLKADELLKNLEDKIAQTEKISNNSLDAQLNGLRTQRKIRSFYPRKTQLATFDKVVAQEVVISNEALYVDRLEGFASFGMKKDESVCKYSKLSDVLSINEDGILIVKKISEKNLFWKSLTH